VGDAVNAARPGRARLDGEARELAGPASTLGDLTGPAEPRWLAEIRLRAARRVLWLRHLWSGNGYGNEHLLAISHSEVDRALVPGTGLSDAEQAFYRSDERAAAVSAQIAVLARQPEDARLGHLVGTLGLSAADTALLTLALASAADPALGRVFGYLLDLPEAADPTPVLAASLFGPGGRGGRGGPGGPGGPGGQHPPGPDSALGRWLLAEPVTPGRDAFAWSTGWRADPLLLPALLGGAGMPGAGAAGPAVVAAAGWSAGASGRVVEPPPDPVLRPDALEEIVGFVRTLGKDGEAGLPIEIELVGPPGSGRTSLAAQAAARLGTRLVAVDAAALAARADPAAAAIREVRRARLDGSVLAWEHAEALSAELRAAVPAAPLTFLSVPAPAAEASGYRSIRRSVGCGPIGRRERLRLWSSLAATPAPAAVADWALRPAEIGVAAHVASAGDHEVGEICRRLLMAGTPALLSPLPLPFSWSDLILSSATAAHLREFEAQAAGRGPVLDEWGFARLAGMGRGTTALFAGPSGTGKTMAAQVLARSLGLDLYRVDLAGVVSKYIGETEKHLREVFEACERAPVLLLFDEADALFGKRTQVSDAHDRYANIEIDYVLQRMEQFDGVAVLATNRKGDLDTAFVRRIRFIIDFAPPTASERERLWRIALEGARDGSGRALTGRLDWQSLGRDLDLTGAGIKSAALAAAFLARSEGGLITERHVRAAARRELEKQGVVVRPGGMVAR
jgi:ATPase family associated with various cellular activities (AAA)